MNPITTDPIIEEVRAIRDEYAAQFSYDVGAIFRDIRIRQEISTRSYVNYPPRRTIDEFDESSNSE